MLRIAALALAGLAALLAAGACSGRSDEAGDGGDSQNAGEGGTSAGAGGTGAGIGGSSSGNAGSSTGGRGGSGTSGASGKGGAAGSGAVGGDAGSVSTGGIAGTTTGGASGTGQGGQAGGGRECETADDCVGFTDCCSCMAVPVGTTGPECDLVCIQSACEAQRIDPEDVTCAFGRCVIDRSCNHSLASCDETPEPCPNGQVRTLNDSGCFGGCLAPTECRDVTDCASCGDAVCVIEEPQIRTFGCVDPGSSCTKGNYCDCLEACPTGGFVCMEGEDAVHCPCPVC